MRITELGDNSMVIMKDSTDRRNFTIGHYYRKAPSYGNGLCLRVAKASGGPWYRACDMVYTAGRLILFFNEDISKEFSLHDRVLLEY